MNNPLDELEEEELGPRRLSPWTALILLVLIASMLVSLLWPLLPVLRQRSLPPTATPPFLQGA
jgi:hypothetical protein